MPGRGLRLCPGSGSGRAPDGAAERRAAGKLGWQGLLSKDPGTCCFILSVQFQVEKVQVVSFFGSATVMLLDWGSCSSETTCALGS